MQYHECVKHAPRFRCTQLIRKLLESMGSEACLPVELFDIIQRVLLRRSTDVKVIIFCLFPCHDNCQSAVYFLAFQFICPNCSVVAV